MINAVGREIPEEILKLTGKDIFRGNHYLDGYEYKKDGPKTRCVMHAGGSKLVKDIHEALIQCGIKDGMTLGFHHHFREGDYIVNMVMEEVQSWESRILPSAPARLAKRMMRLYRILRMERLPESSPLVCGERLEKPFPAEN